MSAAPVVTTVLPTRSDRRGPTTGDGTTGRSRAGMRWRRWRLAFGVLGLLALSGLVSALPAPRTSTTPLDPDSVGPRGSRAVVQVLGDRGVTVVPARRTTDALNSARPAGVGGATILVTDDYTMSDEQIRLLVDSSADVVLLDPSQHTLRQFFGPSTQRAWSTPTRADGAATAAQCAEPDAQAAQALPDIGTGFTSDEPGVVACFPLGGSWEATGGTEAWDSGPIGAHLLTLDRDGRRVVAVSTTRMVENDRVLDEGNAALALRVLGRHETLVWFMPEWEGTVDETESQGGVTDLLPPGVQIALLQLLLVVAVAAVWRGRRLGAVMIEPLPVVVRATETVRGRGRLYRRAQAHGRAGAALRAGTAARCAARLGLPHSAGAEAVVDSIARATGRPPSDIAALIYGPPPTDDASLTALTARLDLLESEVHRP